MVSKQVHNDIAASKSKKILENNVKNDFDLIMKSEEPKSLPDLPEHLYLNQNNKEYIEYVISCYYFIWQLKNNAATIWDPRRGIKDTLDSCKEHYNDIIKEIMKLERNVILFNLNRNLDLRILI